MCHRIGTRSLLHDIHLRRCASVDRIYEASSLQFCAHTWPFRHGSTGETEMYIIHFFSKSVTQVRRDLNSLSLSLSQALVQHYNPKALLKKWEQVHISVWNGMLGMGVASHKRAVARCIHGPLGKDIGRKSFSLSLSRTRTVDKIDPRCTFPHHADNVLAVTVVNKDSSETVRHRSQLDFDRLHNTSQRCPFYTVFRPGAPVFVRQPTIA
jgi:hypothetical protein